MEYKEQLETKLTALLTEFGLDIVCVRDVVERAIQLSPLHPPQRTGADVPAERVIDALT